MASSIDFKLFGPWNKVKALFQDLPKNLKDITTSSQRSIAEKYARKIKAHLRDQDIPGWTPLSPRYADQKMGKYGNEDILLASWKYYESIKVWRQGGIYHVGVPKTETYPNGKEVSKIAALHEAWSTMPGRPHRPLWGYTFKEDMGGLSGVHKAINQLIKEKLQAKGYPVKKLF